MSKNKILITKITFLDIQARLISDIHNKYIEAMKTLNNILSKEQYEKLKINSEK